MMLRPDPSTRITAMQALLSPYFSVHKSTLKRIDLRENQSDLVRLHLARNRFGTITRQTTQALFAGSQSSVVDQKPRRKSFESSIEDTSQNPLHHSDPSAHPYTSHRSPGERAQPRVSKSAQALRLDSMVGQIPRAFYSLSTPGSNPSSRRSSSRRPTHESTFEESPRVRGGFLSFSGSEADGSVECSRPSPASSQSFVIAESPPPSESIVEQAHRGSHRVDELHDDTSQHPLSTPSTGVLQLSPSKKHAALPPLASPQKSAMILHPPSPTKSTKLPSLHGKPGS